MAIIGNYSTFDILSNELIDFSINYSNDVQKIATINPTKLTQLGNTEGANCSLNLKIRQDAADKYNDLTTLFVARTIANLTVMGFNFGDYVFSGMSIRSSETDKSGLLIFFDAELTLDAFVNFDQITPPPSNDMQQLTFTNASLVSGVYSIPIGRTALYQVYDNTGRAVNVTARVNGLNFEIIFSDIAPLTGTWTVVYL